MNGTIKWNDGQEILIGPASVSAKGEALFPYIARGRLVDGGGRVDILEPQAAIEGGFPSISCELVVLIPPEDSVMRSVEAWAGSEGPAFNFRPRALSNAEALRFSSLCYQRLSDKIAATPQRIGSFIDQTLGFLGLKR